MRASLATIAIACVGGLAPAGASANSFSGSCTFNGISTLSPAVTLLTLSSSSDFEGTGTCSGRLNGNRVSAGPMTISAVGPVSTLSCLGSLGLGSKATLRIKRRAGAPAIPFRGNLDVLNIANSATFRLEGYGGGRAVGSTKLGAGGLTAFALKCAGTGIQTVVLTGSFNTVSTLH